MGSLVENNQILSKIATNDQHGEDSPYFDGWKAYDQNPFHLTKNPNGVIQMGLAENQLSVDLIEEWIKENPQASICTSEGVHEFKDISNFQDYHGLPMFRNAIAKFMARTRGNRVAFDPDRIVMSGGATGANELIMFCLADPGDAFLIPAPYYPGFDRDLRWRTGLQLLPIVCKSSNNFQITRESLEATYKKALKDNIKVKGLILTNPSNPLGTILDKATLKSLVTFTNEHKIHLVVDEVYAATVFASPPLTSISEIIEDMKEINRDFIHSVYALSKDMGLPGFRVGVVYSYNNDVVNCARKMSSFGLVSSQTQHLLASLLSDDKFVDNFLVESSKRLANRHNVFTKGLESNGISCLKSNAGLFVWMNLRHLLKELTFEGEMTLWRVIINDMKLNVSPGSSFHCSEPGWFRACFANMDDSTVEVALKRIQTFGRQANNNEIDNAPMRKAPNKRWDNNLRLSFSSLKIGDNNILTSRHMSPSPHSPMPHSPLVRAS